VAQERDLYRNALLAQVDRYWGEDEGDVQLSTPQCLDHLRP
jgi:hypothetical protein